MSVKKSWLVMVALGVFLSGCKQRRSSGSLAAAVGSRRTTVEKEPEQPPIQIIMYGDSEIGMNVPIEMLGRPPTPEEEERGLNFQDEDAWTATAVLYLLALEEAAGVDGERLEGLGLTEGRGQAVQAIAGGASKSNMELTMRANALAALTYIRNLRTKKIQGYFFDTMPQKDAGIRFRELVETAEEGEAMLSSLGDIRYAPNLLEFLMRLDAWDRLPQNARFSEFSSDDAKNFVKILRKGEYSEEHLATLARLNEDLKKLPEARLLPSEEAFIPAMAELVKKNKELRVVKGVLRYGKKELTYTRFDELPSPSESQWLLRRGLSDGELQHALARLGPEARATTLLGGLPDIKTLQELEELRRALPEGARIHINSILKQFELEEMARRTRNAPSRRDGTAELIDWHQTQAFDRTAIPIPVMREGVLNQVQLNRTPNTINLTHCKSGKGRSATIVAGGRVLEVLDTLPLHVKKGLTDRDIDELIWEQIFAVESGRTLADISNQQLYNLQLMFREELAKLKRGDDSLLHRPLKVFEI